MPRYAQVDKYVHGKRLNQGEFIRLLIDTMIKLETLVPENEGFRAREIMETIGDKTWLETANLQLVRQTLSNLRLQDKVTLVKTGAYRANKGKADLGLDKTEEFERMFLDALVENGGFARTGALLTAIGADEPNTTPHTSATRLLSYSPMAQKHYKGGPPALRNLPPEKLATIPFIGRWARLQFAYGYRIIGDLKPDEAYDLADKECIGFFSRIGALYKTVVGLTGEDFVHVVDDHDDLREALLDMARSHPERGRHRSLLILDHEPGGATYERLKNKGWTTAEIDDRLDEKLKTFDEDEFIFTVFDLFCAGDFQTHFAATVAFHQAFADWAGLDAAQLSRGLLVWNLQRTKRMDRLVDADSPYLERFPDEAEPGDDEKDEAAG